MVQVEARERHVPSNADTPAVAVDVKEADTSLSTSPSKTKKMKVASPPTQAAATSTSTTPPPPVGKELISYQMTPKPPPEPLPFPLSCIVMVCWGGNMKYVVFPTLMAVSLGLFLAFSKAVSTATISRGYNHYQNSRQLSEDDPNYLPPSNLLFGNMFKDHMALFNPRLAQQQQQLQQQQQHAQQDQHHLDARDYGDTCDCSRCDVDSTFLGASNSQYKRLIKHSFQHFYGRQELALQVEAFVPSKKKRWDFSPAFYVSASHVCGEDLHPLAVILVHTHHRHFIERNAIRDTWGGVAKGNTWPHRQVPGEVRLIFILEVSEDPIDNDLATKESEKHGDLILVDIQENKHPASRKVLAGFKWVQDYCPGAQYIVKVEEDTFLDLPLLLTVLANQEMTNMILGPIVFADTVKRETSEHKLLVSKQTYFPDYYPPYAMGNVYALPTTLSKRMLEIGEFFPYISVEDAFITGILAKVFDARHINIPERLFDRKPDSKPELCDFVFRRKMAARVTPVLARNLWRRIEKAEMCGLFPSQD